MNDALAEAVDVSNNITGATKLNPIFMRWNDSPEVVLDQLTLFPNEFYKIGMEFKLFGDTLAKTSTHKKLEYTTTYRICMVQSNTKTTQI